jgi:hypothetical protein
MAAIAWTFMLIDSLSGTMSNQPIAMGYEIGRIYRLEADGVQTMKGRNSLLAQKGTSMKLYALASAAALTLAVAATAGPAQAAGANTLPVALSCTGTATATYTPGLQTTPRNVHESFTGQFISCISSSDPKIMSGTLRQSGEGSLSCTQVLAAASSVLHFRWSNGRSSDFSYSATAVIAGGQLVATANGTITGGEFKGDQATLEAVYPAPDFAQCETAAGLRQIGPGSVTLTVTTPDLL